jgi:hypothetical protein
MECPHCHSHDYAYSEYRQRLDWLYSIFGFTSFSCRNCYQIFFEFRLLHNLRDWLGHKALRIRYVHDWEPSPGDFPECAPPSAPPSTRDPDFDSVYMEKPQAVNFDSNPTDLTPEALPMNNSSGETPGKYANA